MALISIVVPVYKVPEKSLKKCIESIRRQTLKNIEILLVDDGSPDNCGKICDFYAGKDERIHVIHKENGGLSSARNTGFSKASSDWLMFVDGDDWIEPDMCEILYQKGTQNDVQLVMCSLWKDYGHSRTRYTHSLQDGHLYTGDECKWLQQQLLVYNANIAFAYCKLFKREYLVRNNILHNEKLKQGAEGLEYNLRAFENLSRAIFVDIPLYHYIYNENSISAATTEANNELVVRCFEAIRQYIDSSSNQNHLYTWFNNRLLYVICTTAISGYFNPDNRLTFDQRVSGFEKFLSNSMIYTALYSDFTEGLSKQRKAVIFLIRHHKYKELFLLGRIRRWQKTRR